MRKLKKALSAVLSAAVFMSVIPAYGAAETKQTAEAAYGTPVIDGKIDEVWNTTNAYVVENCTLEFKEYKGYIKVLWDENYIYVLSKVYSSQYDKSSSEPYKHDSVDVYIDENMNGSTGYLTDDYQVRSDFEGEVTGNNYPDFTKVKTGTEKFDGGFIVEMAIPLVTKTPEEGLTVGFEILMNASETLGVSFRTYNWNTTKNWMWNKTSLWGRLVLKKNVSVQPFNEPKWEEPKVTNSYSEPDEPDTYEFFESATINFDSNTYTYSVLNVNKYAEMAIEDLAAVVGGTAEGNTFKKDDVTVTFTEGSRLAEYNGGHLMLERAPKVWNDRLYVPVSFLAPTFAYYTHYNRFDKIVEIVTGTDYPDTELVFYAKDFGAKGDGVTDDGPAITHAINAAVNSGKPARVELEENKTYILGDRIDNKEYFLLEDVSNLTVDGKGSELVFERCTNSFLRMENCTNVKFENMSVDYKELQFSQGRIVSTDPEGGSFVLDIDEGYPLPASTEWVHNYWLDTRTGKWWFGQVMDPVEDRLKYIKYDHFFVESCEPVKDRQYKITMQAGYESRVKYIEIGDRFVLNTRMSAYDIGDRNMDGWEHTIMIRYSGDITFENFTMYASNHLGVSVGLCWGKINFKHFGEKTKPGRLLCVNSDGIHYWRNRAGVLIENSTFMNNLDDHINTKSETGLITTKIDDYTYELNNDLNIRVGDELIFFDVPNHKILAKTFVKSVNMVNSSKVIVNVDEKFDGIYVNGNSENIRPTMVYNVDSSGKGSVVRNNEFLYSRRHAYIVRSQNTIFENNKTIGCGGSGLIACNEIGAKSSEGPFPSSFTMRNNYIQSEGITDGYYPVEIKSWDAKLGDTAAIDGFLMENNTIEFTPKNRTVSIESVKDLYMINNTLKCSEPLDDRFMPITIVNSDIELIDGINFDYAQNVNAVVNIAGCKVDENNIKNINIIGNNTAKAYAIK